MTPRWTVERIVHFDHGADVVKDGCVHFGFHDRAGRHFAIEHDRHFLGLVAANDTLAWTAARSAVWPATPNIAADIEFPMYADALPDGTVLVSNFKTARLVRIDPVRLRSEVLVDGRSLGMRDMGNCVVDDEATIWINEVTGGRLWRFDRSGRPLLVLGDGTRATQLGDVALAEARFGWIYDIRRGSDDRLYVLDSGNFLVRVVDVRAGSVRTIAGNGHAGYTGDGGPARDATFGSDPSATYDGPISLSVDGSGNLYVGDRYNGVVRMIDARTGSIETIAGSGADRTDGRPNAAHESDPRRLRLPAISSMDLVGDRLFVPTDLPDGSGDLCVLRAVG